MAAARRWSPAGATLLILAGITAIGLALRLPSFGDSMWEDELSTNFFVHGFGITNVFQVGPSDQEGTPPLFFMLAWVTRGIDNAEGLRLVPLLAGLASIPLTYLLALRTVSREAGLVAAAVMALSPFLIYYSTEARAYAPVMLFGLIATLALLSALDSPRTAWWVVYALAVAAAMYTHYTAIFVLIGLFVWAFFARPEARLPLLAATLGAIALFAPYVPQAIHDSNEPSAELIGVIYPLTLSFFRLGIERWTIGQPMTSLGSMPGDFPVALISAGLLIGAAGLLYRILRERDFGWWPPPDGVVLVVVLALATPVGAVIYNISGNSVFGPRNMITSTPGLAVCFGALATAAPGRLRILTVALLLGGFAIGGVKKLDANQRRPDYNGVADFIERTGTPGAPVVELKQPSPGPQTAMEAALADPGKPLPTDRHVYPLGEAPMAARLNRARTGPPSLLTPLPTPTDQQYAGLAARDAGDGKIFIVGPAHLTLAQLSAPGFPLAAFMSALPPRFHEVETRDFPGLYVFGLTVHVLEGDRTAAPS
jgi:Dolichyl-phosphate-mannose-protein mannosyltransferase